jgi:hypothetical protein
MEYLRQINYEEIEVYIAYIFWSLEVQEQVTLLVWSLVRVLLAVSHYGENTCVRKISRCQTGSQRYWGPTVTSKGTFPMS